MIYCGMCNDTGLQNGQKCPQSGCRKANGLWPFPFNSLKTFTIIYLAANRQPRTTYKQEVQAESPDEVLFDFVNDHAHDGHFVAAIVEAPADKVFMTKDQS